VQYQDDGIHGYKISVKTQPCVDGKYSAAEISPTVNNLIRQHNTVPL